MLWAFRGSFRGSFFLTRGSLADRFGGHFQKNNFFAQGMFRIPADVRKDPADVRKGLRMGRNPAYYPPRGVKWRMGPATDGFFGTRNGP